MRGYINIVMKRDQSKGWSGSISEEVQRQYRGRYFQDITSTMRQEFELSTGLGMSLDKVINESYCVYDFKDGHQRSTRKRTIAPWPSYKCRCHREISCHPAVGTGCYDIILYRSHLSRSHVCLNQQGHDIYDSPCPCCLEQQHKYDTVCRIQARLIGEDTQCEL